MAGRGKHGDRRLGETRTRDPSLDDTLDAPDGLSGLSAPVGRSAEALSAADLDEAQRLIESSEQDQLELATIDPEQFVRGYEMARGGMGRIVAARDRRLGRIVAIKELIQDSPGGSAERSEREARFEREALITARLQHPAIVNLYSAGRWPTGKPFYTMKLVAGRSLAQVASEGRSLAERFALLPNLIAMVEAVAYAHLQRIIHRDLKPSNVLIGDLGETVVIDWGLAKDLAARPGDRTHLPARPGGAPRLAGGAPLHGAAESLTIDGEVIGTPGYMPPEQAAGEEMDERADVYALGAILYHLLGGAAPYQGSDAEAILTAVLLGPPRPLLEVEARLPQDLVTIIEKAMARDPAARYATAVQLAQDLRRFQTGQLVAAHRYSRRELVWRFVVRHRAAVVAAASALVIVAAVGLVSFRRIAAERDRAEAAGVAAALRADELTVAQATTILDEDPLAAVELLARLSPSAPLRLWRTARMAALDARLHGIPVVGRLVNGLANYTMSADGKVVVSSELHDVRLWDLATGEGRLVGRQPVGIREVRVSPDHRFIATAGFDNKIRLWSVGTGSMTELGGHETVVTDFEFLPDGDRLISASADGAIWLWRASGAGHQLIGRHPGGVAHIAASGDGRKLASSGADGAVRVWRVDGSGSGEPPRELRRGGARLDRVAISADGARVAAIGTPGEVWLWDVASGKGRHLSGHEGMMMTVAFSADGRLLATAGEDRTVRLWDVETGESTLLRGHTDTVGQVTFAAAGTDLLFTAAFDETIRVWLVDGKSASTVQVLKGGVGPFGITPDGTMVVKYDEAGRRSWTVGDGRRTLRGHSGTVTQIEFAGDRAIVSAGADSTVRVWPLGEKAPGAPRVMRGHKADVTSLSASPDGRLAASIDKHRFVWLWDLAGGTGRELSGRAYGTPRFSPDGAILAAPSEDHVVRLWSTASGEARVLRGHTSWVTAVAISPDGRRLASASADKTIRLWDFDTGASRVLSGHETAVRAVEFAGAGRLVSSDMAGVVREWEVAGGAGRELGRANKGATALAVAPDGELVAWADGAGDTHLWSRRSGQSRVLHRHGRAPDIDQLLFSSDGRTLLGRDPDGLVILWDTSTDAFLVLPSYHRTIADLAMSPDAATVATAESDRSVRLWSYDLPYEPDALRAWLKKAARPASP